MSELLSNPNVQAALSALLVVAINAAVQWVRGKVSYSKLVNDNWCYIQPLRDAAINQAIDAVRNGTWGTAAARDIAVRALASLAETYRKNEDVEPSATLLAAASDEIEKAMSKAASTK